MAGEVVMPRLGWTMETGTFAGWLKPDGAAVQAGESLFTVETDKVAQEVEALDSGILRIPPDAVAPGVEVPVGTVLAYLVQPGEPPPFEQQTPGAAEQAPGPAVSPASLAADNAADASPRASAAAAPQGVDGGAVPAISPRARRVAQELGVAWTALAGSGRTGRIVERDVRAHAAQAAPARARISPVARRIARQTGVDVDQLASQLPRKRITRTDVETAIPVAAPAAADQRAGQPLSRARRVIAERMAHSAHTAAPVTLTTQADATELAALRLRIKQAAIGATPLVPSYTDLLARLVALALREHPWLNSSLEGETIVQHPSVHMGIAVDTERGLLVPVIRDAQHKSIQRIAVEAADLIARAREGTATADDLSGSTFTITNLGMYDIDAFTPIINLPACAILGLGRIVAQPVVVDDAAQTVAVRKMLALSLTFDHRVVDGAPAARFLQQIKRWVEQPFAWITA